MGRDSCKEAEVMLSRQNLPHLLHLPCIAAVFIGFWYYSEQIVATPALLLIFVPDCPLYVLLSLPIMFGLIKNGAYSFFVSIGMVKYGLWTVFVLIFHSKYYAAPSALPITVIFIIGHIGMALLGSALLPKKRVAFAVFALALAWFLLNDYADYFLGTRPPIPLEGMGLIQNLTIAASFALTLGFFLFSEKVRSLAPVKFFRQIIGN